jgi:predicted nucleotidyltransferase
MIEEKIQEHFTNKPGIAAVYLYGSYAKGQVRHESDVDIAILFGNRDRDIVNKRLEKIHVELSRCLRKEIHLTALDFAGEMLLKQILKSGRCLIVNDTEALKYFTMNALSKILDFQYYLNKFQSAMVRRVMEGL